MKNILLIGFMGVGKGSVARAMMKHSKMMILDTDDIIESLENCTVKKIFATQGEEHFRALERKIGRWLKKEVTGSIISTGGGFFKVPALKKIGTVVLLEASFETIYSRIVQHPNGAKKLKKRPLFAHIEKAKELYDERQELYHKVADIVIDVTDKDFDTIAKEILKKVKI